MHELNLFPRKEECVQGKSRKEDKLWARPKHEGSI